MSNSNNITPILPIAPLTAQLAALLFIEQINNLPHNTEDHHIRSLSKKCIKQATIFYTEADELL